VLNNGLKSNIIFPKLCSTLSIDKQQTQLFNSETSAGGERVNVLLSLEIQQ